MKNQELQIEVYGRVQGVNFRAMIKNFCDKEEIKGYVMNRDDGSVMIVAQGEKRKLDELLDWVRKNPGLSKVINVEVKWKKSSFEYKEFSITRERGYMADKAKSLVSLGRSFFAEDLGEIPSHISIIPDGNRRWAREKGLRESLGHYKSAEAENIKSLINESKKFGVKYLTIWGFSTENWRRNKEEINAIFSLIENVIKTFRKEAHENKIKFRHIGRKDRIPRDIASELEKLEEETKNYGEFNIQLALDYGGRDEIVRAVNKIIKEGKKEIEEEEIGKYFDTYGIPDPDLIIRTGGEQRISGFMPYQGAYAEFYFTDVYFPDFDAKELRKAIAEYSKRQRRFGGN